MDRTILLRRFFSENDIAVVEEDRRLQIRNLPSQQLQQRSKAMSSRWSQPEGTKRKRSIRRISYTREAKASELNRWNQEHDLAGNHVAHVEPARSRGSRPMLSRWDSDPSLTSSSSRRGSLIATIDENSENNDHPKCPERRSEDIILRSRPTRGSEGGSSPRIPQRSRGGRPMLSRWESDPSLCSQGPKRVLVRAEPLENKESQGGLKCPVRAECDDEDEWEKESKPERDSSDSDSDHEEWCSSDQGFEANRSVREGNGNKIQLQVTSSCNTSYDCSSKGKGGAQDSVHQKHLNISRFSAMRNVITVAGDAMLRK